MCSFIVASVSCYKPPNDIAQVANLCSLSHRMIIRVSSDLNADSSLHIMCVSYHIECAFICNYCMRCQFVNIFDISILCIIIAFVHSTLRCFLFSLLACTPCSFRSVYSSILHITSVVFSTVTNLHQTRA